MKIEPRRFAGELMRRRKTGLSPTAARSNSTVNGQRSTVNGQRSTVNGQRSTVNGQRPIRRPLAVSPLVTFFR